MKISDISKIGKVWKLFSVALLGTVLVIALYVFVFSQISQKKQHIEALANSIQTLEEQNQAVVSAKDSISETIDLRNKIDEYFVAKDGEVNFLNFLQTLGTEEGLSLEVSSVSIDPSPAASGVFELLNLEVQVQGPWSNVSRFLALLELLPYKISMGDVAIRKQSDAELSGNQKKSTGTGPQWVGDFKMSLLKFK
ncbi:MAG: hypothetical protein V4467_03245 [Patescibacteria group bacterium]